MILDISGIELTPNNNGKDCKGNGEHLDENGNIIECCCDECDYMICCSKSNFEMCKNCAHYECPHAKK